MRLAFNPRRDGFAFPNSFAWTEAELAFLERRLRRVSYPATVALTALAGGASGRWRGLAGGSVVGAGLAASGWGDGLMRAAARRWPSVGLCGGMALTAGERWRMGATPATSSLRPEHVRLLLWRRQLRTLELGGATFARLWLQVVAGRRDFSRTNGQAWRQAERRIAAGSPVVIGLVGPALDPCAMHQVLAFGYDACAGARTLSVYDPNAPGQTRRLTLHAEGDRQRLTTSLPTPFLAAFVVT